MNGKANAFTIITFLLAMIAAYLPQFIPAVQSWLGIVSFIGTALISTYMTNGTWVKGWDTTMWVVTIAGTLIQLGNQFAAANLIPAATISGIVMGIQVFINVFYKSYGGNTSIAEKKIA